jgi:hypothetical protein
MQPTSPDANGHDLSFVNKTGTVTYHNKYTASSLRFSYTRIELTLVVGTVHVFSVRICIMLHVELQLFTKSQRIARVEPLRNTKKLRRSRYMCLLKMVFRLIGIVLTHP